MCLFDVDPFQRTQAENVHVLAAIVILSFDRIKTQEKHIFWQEKASKPLRNKRYVHCLARGLYIGKDGPGQRRGRHPAAIRQGRDAGEFKSMNCCQAKLIQCMLWMGSL